MHFNIHKDFIPKLRGDHDLPSNITAPLSRIYIFRGDNYRVPKVLQCPPLKDAQNRRGSFSGRRQESILAGPKATAVKFHQGISSVQAGIDFEDGERDGDADDAVVLRADTDGNITFCNLNQTIGFGSHSQVRTTFISCFFSRLVSFSTKNTINSSKPLRMS